MVVLIDNYDSFSYNLVQYFQRLNQSVAVYQNDGISVNELITLKPEHIVISPGPNSPEEAGISVSVIRNLYDQVPILGVCLGHQCIAQAFGGKIIQADDILHGKTSIIEHSNQNLFHTVPNPFQATRYHSLIVEKTSLPDCFSIDAWTGDTVMAIRHLQYPLYGVQFHPESILSEHGLNLLNNFIHCNENTSQGAYYVSDRRLYT